MHIGLFFGSFNPVHIGHLIIANYIVESTSLDQIWFIVSPQNPLKRKQSLLNEYDRLHLVELAVEDNDRLRASNVEFSLPRPSYTIDTLIYLKEKYPDHELSLIMGMDNLVTLHRWKNYEILLRDYQIYVYPRPAYEVPEELRGTKSIHVVAEVPFIPVSATFIRDGIKAGKKMRYFLPDKVLQYIEEMHFYK